MRIWAFPSFYPYDYPGMKWGGIFAHRQYKGLAASGADVKVIQPVLWHPIAPFSNLHKEWETAAQYNYPLKRIYDGITVYHPRISNMKPSRIFNKPFQEKYADAIINFFKKEQIQLDLANDIFYSQWIPDAAMVQLAAHKLGVKSAILVVGDDVLVWPHNSDKHLAIFKETMEKADMRFCVAGYLATEANKLVGHDLPFNTARRGVNYDFFKPLPDERKQLKKEFGIPDGKTIILTIGTAIARKGWLDLFDAAAKIKKETGSFMLVGVHAGTPEFNLDDEANARGLKDDFINLGSVDPDKINRLYNTADIFCLPSHWEGLANSVVEAMSSGLAVVTTNVCGHPELITSEQNGILVPPKRPDILAEALSLLIKDAGKRAELGSNARNFIVNVWGSFADNAALLYKKLSE